MSVQELYNEYLELRKPENRNDNIQLFELFFRIHQQLQGKVYLLNENSVLITEFSEFHWCIREAAILKD